MALVVKDRVQETSTTTGTGTFTLGGATSGFQSFSVIGNGNTTYYAIVGGAEWEVGLGTYTSSGTTLSRDTILESSSGGSAVNFSAGTKSVFCTYPAERSLTTDAIGTSVQAFDADTTKNDLSNTFTFNQIISVTDNTNAALRITQLGTGNSLIVEDSSNPDSTSFVINANGDVGIGVSIPSTKLTVGRIDSSNEGGQLDLCRSSDNTSAWAVDVYGSTSTPSLRFVDNVASATRVEIDGSANFKFNSGYGSAATAYGCRAWVNFNGTGTVAIRASGNVTSITDNGNGDYTLNFTTAMPDTNYAAVTGMSANNVSSNGNEFYVSTQVAGPSYNSGYTTTTSLRMVSMDGTGTNRDCADLNVAIFR